MATKLNDVCDVIARKKQLLCEKMLRPFVLAERFFRTFVSLGSPSLRIQLNAQLSATSPQLNDKLAINNIVNVTIAQTNGSGNSEWKLGAEIRFRRGFKVKLFRATL